MLRSIKHALRERSAFQTFAQPQRLSRQRWDEELRRLSEVPVSLAERALESDPRHLGRLMDDAVAEVLADARRLSAGRIFWDLQPLLAALWRVSTGFGGAASQRTVRRFFETLRVKALYGPEYYADPTRTPVGQAPRAAIHREGRHVLYRYQRSGAPRGAPVLVCYSLINEPYILDLLPGHSFICHLLDQGLDVYLVDWAETEPGDRTTTLDSLVDPVLVGCVDEIARRTGAPRVSLFGHCIGGDLALMLAALHPERVERLITLTTPITASQGGLTALWTDRDTFPVDAIVDAFGHMPAKLIRYTFMALKPYYEVVKWRMFLEQVGDDEAMQIFNAVDRWANENRDIPGAVFRKFVFEVFHADRFRHGRTRIGGRRVDLGAIRCPVLNLAAARDWIVSPASAEALGEALPNADYRYVSIPGAHVSIMIDPRSRPLWTTMSDFLLGGDHE